MRKFLLIASLLLAPALAQALGMGAIELHSSLNQPLKARIELIGLPAGGVDDLHAKLASPKVFERAGIERSFFLTRLRFKPLLIDGKAYLEVTTRETVREPYLDFLVVLSWRQGTLMRQFTLLLDPPGYQPQLPITAAASEPQPLTEATPLSPAATYGPVQPGESLWSIAARLAPSRGVTTEQMSVALFNANPTAFLSDDINQLKLGAQLQLPTTEVLQRLDARSARQQFVSLSRSVAKSETPVEVDNFVPVTPMGTSSPRLSAQLDNPEKRPAEPTEPKSGAWLRLVEPGREWQIGDVSHLGKEVYPASPEDRLREAIVDSQGDLQAVREINRDLDQLKGALESKIAALQEALGERDRAIAELRTQLEQVAQEPKPEAPEVRSETSAQAPASGGSVAPTTTPGAKLQQPMVPASPDRAAESSDDLASLLDEFLQQPYALALLIVLGGLLLIALLLLLRVVRRNKVDDDTELFSTFTDFEDEGEDDYDDDLVSGAFGNDSDAADEDDDLESSIEGGDIASVLTEADIYLAYRRYNQAERLIDEALRRLGSHAELMAKRLEIYAFRRDAKGFSRYLDEIHTALAHDAPELLERMLEVGRGLVPDHPLLKPGAIEGTAKPRHAPLEVPRIEEDTMITHRDDLDLDLNISVDELLTSDDQVPDTSGIAVDEVDSEDELDIPSLDLDFDDEQLKKK